MTFPCLSDGSAVSELHTTRLFPFSACLMSHQGDGDCIIETAMQPGYTSAVASLQKVAINAGAVIERCVDRPLNQGGLAKGIGEWKLPPFGTTTDSRYVRWLPACSVCCQVGCFCTTSTLLRQCCHRGNRRFLPHHLGPDECR